MSLTAPVIATIAVVSGCVIIVAIVAGVVLAKKRQAKRGNQAVLSNAAYVSVEPARGQVIFNPTYETVSDCDGSDSA